MLTAKDALAKLKAENTKIRIESCKDYGSDWLFTAFVHEDDMDPFYLINKTTGEVTNYTIAENPRRYYSTPDVDV